MLLQTQYPGHDFVVEENGNVCLSALPEDLRLSVQEDNEAFAREIDNWNNSSGQQRASGNSRCCEGLQQHNGGDSWLSSNNNNSNNSNRNRNTNFTMAERGWLAY